MSVPVVESSKEKMEEGPQQIFLVPKKRSFNFKKMDGRMRILKHI